MIKDAIPKYERGSAKKTSEGKRGNPKKLKGAYQKRAPMKKEVTAKKCKGAHQTRPPMKKGAIPKNAKGLSKKGLRGKKRQP
jgi:hypothetical protein